MELTTNNTQNNVIDLRELFSVLKRRKKLISLVTVFITILAIVYAFFIAKPLYEVQASIEMAQINKKPVQEIGDLKQKLETEFEVNTKGEKTEFPIVSNIRLPKNTKNIMNIQVQGYDNSTAQQKLQEVTNHIISLQDKELNDFTDIQIKRIQLVKENVDLNEKLILEIKKDINNYENKLFNISKQDAALAGIYAIELSRKQAELNNITSKVYNLKNKINEYEISISLFQIHKAAIIGKIQVLDKPIKPKKKLIVIVTFITGFMFSIFLVLFLEFIKGLKQPIIKEDP